MAHLASVKPSISISTFPSKTTTLIPRSRLFQAKAVTNGTVHHSSPEKQLIPRRNIALIGLAGMVIGLGGGAEAAARRPPPPPPEEKKDPNVTGLAAKVLASKKRKEAMKESVAKLRERGKKITEEKPAEAQ